MGNDFPSNARALVARSAFSPELKDFAACAVSSNDQAAQTWMVRSSTAGRRSPDWMPSCEATGSRQVMNGHVG